MLNETAVIAQDIKTLDGNKQKEVAGILNAFAKNITSLQAKFTQEKVFTFMEDKLVSEGEFWFSTPDKIRWQYNTPYPYLIIMSDGKMTVNDEGETYTMDMRSNQMFQQMNSLISMSIQGTLLENELDYDQLYFESADTYIIQFIPKSSQLKQYLSAIELYFSKKDGQVLSLKMIESAGDYTFISFRDRIENQKLNAQLFILDK